MIIVKVLTSSLAVAVCAASLNVSAANKAPGSGPNPFSDCGIGAALFKDTKWAAVTSNVIWDVGTTAVTSATASPETCTGVKVVAAKFIIDNYDNIVEEIAEGSGTHLTAMYNVLGCGETAQAEMTSNIRRNIANTIAASDYQEQSLVEKSSHLYSVVNDSSVVNNCAAI
ncbi:Protein of unknown function [Colwellia chukchiensis]|uniref:DUF3015 domain-containing protein n=1 Tax=Colwellia chukchiensis TaxID=641665 RepID=A0A1H7PEK6_9GAMM|nr:DUF3015 family protein [Colwellia chukchiensis]SEL34210.1 Protein of unknown function [Colwellia chukchiensis]